MAPVDQSASPRRLASPPGLVWGGLALGWGLALILAILLATHAGSGTRSHPATSAAALPLRTSCVYTHNSLARLAAFDQLVGRNLACEMVYNDSSTGWSDWQDPWFLGSNPPDQQLTAWATTPGAHRTLIITQSLFPASENGVDWLEAGARGDYAGHARTLARNLVAAGLGGAVIRLAHEANDTAYPYSIPGTASGDAKWVQFWRRTVIAMRSVPGAHFIFDWCVNAGYRDIPLASFYPGDDVVDVIGVDAYDTAVTGSGSARWLTIYNLPDGLGAVAAFAAAHGKPMSIPEWGIGPASDTQDRFGGDDPAFVNGIASLVATHDVAYQSYFDSGLEASQLADSPQSLVAYIAHFGAGGDAVAPELTGGASLSSVPPTGVSAGSLAGAPSINRTGP